jgi:hypothetical protein
MPTVCERLRQTRYTPSIGRIEILTTYRDQDDKEGRNPSITRRGVVG